MISTILALPPHRIDLDHNTDLYISITLTNDLEHPLHFSIFPYTEYLPTNSIAFMLFKLEIKLENFQYCSSSSQNLKIKNIILLVMGLT